MHDAAGSDRLLACYFGVWLATTIVAGIATLIGAALGSAVNSE